MNTQVFLNKEGDRLDALGFVDVHSDLKFHFPLDEKTMELIRNGSLIVELANIYCDECRAQCQAFLDEITPQPIS